MVVARAQRLVFGEVAELYDRHRPAYPQQLLEDLLEQAELRPAEPVLEVGAGTGKATAMFAAREISVVAIEPSEAMAAIARRNCSAFPSVEVELADFESWEPRGRSFPLLYSAQAWHWVRAEVGYAKARSVLKPGGVLAVFWTHTVWERSPLRGVLDDVYRRVVPELGSDGFLHPSREWSADDSGWASTIAASDGLGQPEVRSYDWSAHYTGEAYAGLLETSSQVRLLDSEPRRALLAAVVEAIDANGAGLELPLRTRLCLARRSDRL